jgi:GlpG protein
MRFPPTQPVTLILIIASVAVTLWSFQGVDQDTLAELAIKYPGIDANTAKVLPLLISLFPFHSPDAFYEVRHGEIWRLFTPIFIHGGMWHLSLNMIAMQSLGSAVEAQNGRRLYIAMIAVLALATNLAQYIISGPFFEGMSGVLYGLFSYIWLRSICDPASGFYIPRRGLLLTLGFFIVCFTGLFGHIGNAAHSTGLVLGAIWGIVAGRLAVRRYRAMPRPQAWRS